MNKDADKDAGEVPDEDAKGENRQLQFSVHQNKLLK